MQKKVFLCYIDLLETGELIRQNRIDEIIDHYEIVTEKLNNHIKHHADLNLPQQLQTAYFSDTFIFWLPAEKQYIPIIESAIHYLAESIITHGIIFRGAISCGDFYADQNMHFFTGPALVEAYKYAETMNCINFCLCPSFIDEVMGLCNLNFKERLHYSTDDFEVKHHPGSESTRIEERTMCLIGKSYTINGSHPVIDALIAKRNNSKEKFYSYYDTTLSFIEKHKRT